MPSSVSRDLGVEVDFLAGALVHRLDGPEVRTVFSTVMPEAASVAVSFLNLASPLTAKSAPACPSSLQVRKPKDWMRSLEDVLGNRRACRLAFLRLGADGDGDLRVAVVADKLDALVARHLVQRLLHQSHVDAARVVTEARPSLPVCGGSSCSTAAMNSLLRGSRRVRTSS